MEISLPLLSSAISTSAAFPCAENALVELTRFEFVRQKEEENMRDRGREGARGNITMLWVGGGADYLWILITNTRPYQ